MSPTPRRLKHRGRHAPPSARSPQLAIGADPSAGLRALVEEGITIVAALNARDDLEQAAASTLRLGSLTSGMWRALSRELSTAAERLHRSTTERLQDSQRRARALDVDMEQVIAAGGAAGHLVEHRETLESLIKPGADARYLLGANMLFGFSLDAALDAEGEDDESQPNAGTVVVSLFLWQTPLQPAIVSIAPSLLVNLIDAPQAGEDRPAALAVSVPPPLLHALTTECELTTEAVSQSVITLGMACLSAHHIDEEPLDGEDDEEEHTDDDLERDGGPSGNI
ncbi:MAG: hypothetical protein ACR2IK_20905 [Chloroflexota bacterium]